LPILYDKDVVSEDAIMRWAEEKEHADESDKIFVKQSEAFIQVYIYMPCIYVGSPTESTWFHRTS
jgi:hypothetical protein